MLKIIPPIQPDMQGEAVANLQAVFQILFEKDLIDLSAEQREIVSKYGGNEVHGSVYGPASTEIVRAIQRKYHLEDNGIVDEETANLLSEILKECEPKNFHFKVKGTVHYPDNSIATGLLVWAFDKDLRSDQFLGETTTNQSGEYTIAYSWQQFNRAEKKSADLIIRVVDQDDPEKTLAESAVFYNAPENATINLTVEFDLSEFERLLHAASTLFRGEEVLPTDLTDDDIDFLAHETSFEANILHIFVAASSIVVGVQIDIDLPFQDITALFYGLGRKGESMKLAELIIRDFFLLKNKLQEALDEKIIPAYLSEWLESFFEELDRIFNESNLEKEA